VSHTEEFDAIPDGLPALEVSHPDHRSSRSVGVWLSPLGSYVTACPHPEKTDEGGWSLSARISAIAIRVGTAQGWDWIDRAVARAVFPGFHCEGRNISFGEEEDEANPMVMDLLFSQ